MIHSSSLLVMYLVIQTLHTRSTNLIKLSYPLHVLKEVGCFAWTANQGLHKVVAAPLVSGEKSELLFAIGKESCPHFY